MCNPALLNSAFLLETEQKHILRESLTTQILLLSAGLIYFKHCQRHNGPRVLHL